MQQFYFRESLREIPIYQKKKKAIRREDPEQGEYSKLFWFQIFWKVLQEDLQYYDITALTTSRGSSIFGKCCQLSTLYIYPLPQLLRNIHLEFSVEINIK